MNDIKEQHGKAGIRPVILNGPAAKRELAVEVKRIPAKAKEVSHKTNVTIKRIDVAESKSIADSKQSVESPDKSNLTKISKSSVFIHKLQATLGRFCYRHRKLLIVSTSIIILLSLFWFGPWFRFKERLVRGNIIIQDQSLLQVAGLDEGEHFLKQLNIKSRDVLHLEYRQAEEKILNFYPELKSAVVKFEFPKKLVIDVQERVAVACIERSGQYYVIDGENVVISNLQERPKDLPTIKGIEFTDAKIGQILKTDKMKDLNKSLAIVAEMIHADSQTQADFNLPSLIETVEIRDDGLAEIKMHYRELKIKVIAMPTNYLRENFDRLKRILVADYLSEYGSGTLDITGKNLYYMPDNAEDSKLMPGN